MARKIPTFLKRGLEILDSQWSRISPRLRPFVVFSIFSLAVSVVYTVVFWDVDHSFDFQAGDVASKTIRSPEELRLENFQLKRGQILIRAGDIVSDLQAQLLSEFHKALTSNETFVKAFLGDFLLSLTALSVVYIFSMTFWPGFRPKDKDLCVVGLTVVGSLFLEKIFSVLSHNLSYSFSNIDTSTLALSTPFAAGGIMLQVTLGAPAVFLFAVSFSLITSLTMSTLPSLVFLIICGNMIGAAGVKRCTHRSAFITTGFRVAAVNIIVVTTFLLTDPSARMSDWYWYLMWSAVGGVLSGMLGGALAPVAEFLGGYATDIKLLELSSLERPLLRELSLQAPGTWNHSMVVGQMCEVAAEAIHANPYLARVGAYYHDIGKIKKPPYFVENQAGRENRHDKLTPSMSALIIKAHVKDGLEMAEQSGIPEGIKNFIAQHHGTSLIEYFYEKALKEAEQGDTVDESHYRYPGPRPQTKEAGLLMLADCVEAASRTLTDPTPAKIQGLVQKIINKIFASGELDESNLTLKDLHRIAKSFTRVISAIHHRRIEHNEPAEKVRDTAAKEASKEQPITLSDQVVRLSQENGTTKPDRSSGEEELGKKPQEGIRKKGTSGDSAETLRRLGLQ